VIIISKIICSAWIPLDALLVVTILPVPAPLRVPKAKYAASKCVSRILKFAGVPILQYMSEFVSRSVWHQETSSALDGSLSCLVNHEARAAL